MVEKEAGERQKMRANASALNGSLLGPPELALDRPPWVASILIFTIVVDILGNLLVILSVYRNKKLRNADAIPQLATRGHQGFHIGKLYAAIFVSAFRRRKLRKGFAQKSPPFLPYLKNILRKYPDGGQILKELIQNADDAGASEVIFIHDERNYGTESLWSEDLLNFQGPALLAYNSATFSDDDWEGLQSTGQSLKFKDPNTVGRFGLGFNSVYHITDLPGVFSGRHIGMLDPQRAVFDDGGFMWTLDDEEDRKEVESLSDQFLPFCDVLSAIERGDWNTIRESGYFKGTLFRFPLRSSPSEISDHRYSKERVKELFECFSTDVIIGLLFLRNVTQVSLKTIGQDGVVKHLLTASCQDDRTLENINGAPSELLTTMHVRETSLKVPGRSDEVCKWLVMASTVKDGSFQDLEDLAKKLHNIPTIGLAYSLTGEDRALHGGRLSCFLPLPDREENRTGFPVVINASFDLTDDRRSIKWVEMDQQHDDAAQWNSLLVEKLLPLVYCQAVSVAVSVVRSSDGSATLAYGIWPDPCQTQHKERWHGVTEKISQNLWNMDVCLAADRTRWLKPSEAVFVSTMQDNDIQNALESLLLCVGEPLVRVPMNILKTLQLTSSKHNGLKMVTPNFIRGVLRNGLWHNLDYKQKLLILEYIISDGQYKDLLGIQLLPLFDGTLIRFMDTDHDGTAFIDSNRYPRLLLPGLAGRFLPTDLKPEILQHLRTIGDKGLFCNLVCLNKDEIIKNLCKALPDNWMNDSKQVTWNPSLPDQPPIDWLHGFWNFLQQDVDVLSPFEGFPIIPIRPILEHRHPFQLARLEKKSSLLILSEDGYTLTENCAKVMEVVGCTVIRQWDSQMWHKCRSQYVMAPSPNNILKSFSNLGMNMVLRRIAEITSEEKKMLSELLAQASNLNTEELKVLSQLPIFSKMGSLHSPGSELVAAGNLRAVGKGTIPAVPIDLALPEVLLICRDENDRRLLLHMGVQFLSAADVACLAAACIKNGQYANQQKEAVAIMLWVLRNGDVLFGQSNELRKTCESLPFLDSNGNKEKPSAFFDPQIQTFQDLFASHRFPPKCYHEPLILKSLRTLGMKHSLENINSGDILHIAEEVSNNQDVKELQVLMRKVRALVRLCNDTQVLSTFEEIELEKLCCLSWVPIGLSNEKPALQKPTQLRSMKYSPLVQLSMPLTDEFNEMASEILGLNKPPPAEKVIENLTILCLQFHPKECYSLARILRSIYKHIQDHLDQFSTFLSCIKIWNGDGFSVPTEILLSYPDGLDLSCQMKKVPQEFSIYRTAFLRCGVRETISHCEVIDILHKLMQNIQGRHSSCGTPDELKLAISILDWMKRGGVHATEELPVPVQDGNGGFTMKPLSLSLFCDMPKERLKDLGDDLDYNIVHEDIPLATAIFLKLPLLSTKFLKPEYFEPWGPSEPITLRIKNILREYSEEVDLFKELIQNADDAGATVCNFLVDMRQNLQFRSSLLDPAMASCHGPALWSYNNSKFSDKDFRNITRVGAATKELEVEKIGKFGLGFNTVYRVTDVPSILSGGNILIFDPNANHLRKHIQSEANPGIKLNFQVHPRVLQVFADQFYPYHKVFECDLKKSLDYNGTIIRLPFRTVEDAIESKICNQSFSTQEILSFAGIFQDSTQNLIIFLKGVQEVALKSLTADSSSPDEQTLTLLLKRSQIQRMIAQEDYLLQKRQKTVAEALAQSKLLDFNGSSIIAVTMTKPPVTNSNYYLLHSSFGIGESFQTFQENMQKKIRFDIPVAGVALPLITTDTGKWRPDLEGFDGQVFCFLPLPIFSGLPFHLNGSFSVMSNRKSLWENTEKGEWNRKLLSDAVIVTWARALAQLQQMYQDGALEKYSYHTFWPDIRKTKSIFVEALKAFYRAMANGLDDEDLALFSNEHEWCSIKRACFLSSDIVKNTKIGDIAARIFSEMLPKPFIAVSLPEWVKDGFQTSGCGEALLKNTYSCERFYKEIVFNNLPSLPAKDRDALIIHAIDMNNLYVTHLLKSTCCIPSTPSGDLKSIKMLIHPQGKVASLFDVEEGCFPSGTPQTYLNDARLSRLEHLGMLKDKLSAAQLIERAQTIATLWEHDKRKACIRIRKVLDLLPGIIENRFSNRDQAEFRKISFLPAILPHSNRMQGSNSIVLKRPTEIFHYNHFILVNMSEPVLLKEHAGQYFNLSSNIAVFLGLKDNPSLHIVVLQIEKAQNSANFLTKQELTEMVRKCYIYLNKKIEDDPEKKQEICRKLGTFPFILIGEEFVSLKCVALKISFEAAPYLYKLPLEYLIFERLWQCVGLSHTFTFEDYTALLKSMAKKYNGKHLTKTDLDLALTVINSGLHGTNENPVTHYQANGIFLPDQDGILCPADKLHFNDTPWLPSSKETRFCHEMIPRAVALRLRVPTKIHKAMQNLKISGLSHWVSNFGAKEDLTRRIRNIISEYASKKDILKELIQNADDSGATELHFVLDRRTHSAVSTFGKEWKPLQGPALCIYNNTLFTNEDIDGIQQLGKGGKWDRYDKTGKYGLGFNVVYHLTDCPSFVTGDSMLCVFDPNLLFLPTSDDHSPGGMFTVNQEFKATFTDVYNSFLPSLFDLEQGTLFRLPLRTAETVARSRISEQTVSSHDIEALCQELKEDADNFILFLNNIQKITFSEITVEDSQMRSILSIETELTSECASKRLAFQNKLNQLAQKCPPTADIMPFQVFYKMIVKCSSATSSTKWMLAKQIGVEGEDKLNDLRRVSESLTYLRLPHGAIAACMNSYPKGRAFCTLPLPVETGLPVHISGSFIVDSARRDICKEDGGSAKTEWNSLILTQLLAPLYSDLLAYICRDLSQSRQTPLEFENFKACENCLDPHFLRFFPCTSEVVPPIWQKMIIQVYHVISEKQFKLIPIYKLKTIRVGVFSKETVIVEWSAVGGKDPADKPYFIICDIQPDVKRVLHTINLKFVCRLDSLLNIFKELERAGLAPEKVSPMSVCIFLTVARLYPEESALPLPVNDTLLKTEIACSTLLQFCIQAECENAHCLNKLPLLVTEDCNLREFCQEDPKFYSTFSELFPAHTDQFASCRVIKSQHVPVLLKAGFLKHFSIEESAGYIKEHLGEGFHIPARNGNDCVPLQAKDMTWLKRLWEYFESVLPKDNVRDNESNSKIFNHLIGHFSDWAILPVSSLNHKNVIFLLNLGNCSNVLYEWSNEVSKYLAKLGFARLNTSCLPFNIAYHCIQPHLLQTSDSYSVVEKLWSRRGHLQWSNLTNLEAVSILWCLYNGFHKSKDKQNYLYYLRHLPLFETTDGGRQCLADFPKRYILETKMSNEWAVFHALSRIDTQTVFLRDDPLYRKLSNDLNIKVFNDLQFLVHFLLPLLPTMQEEQVLQVLKLLLRIQALYIWQSEEQEKKTFSSLGSVRFIRDMDGKLQLPSYFYNHEHLIFKSFQLHSRFIPENFFQQLGYSFCKLKDILIGLGMKDDISDDDFVKFATQVENEAKSGISVKLLKPKTKVLFSHLLGLQIKCLKQDFIDRVSDIHFVAPVPINDDLQKLCSPYAKSNSLVALKGALVKSNNEDLRLVWTSMNILKEKTRASKSLLETFGVLLAPTTELVLENLRNVCKASCSGEETHKIRSAVLRTTYDFLQKQLPFDPSPLIGVPVILLEDNALAEPSHVVFSLPEDTVFRPYLFKVPPMLAPYGELFQNFGVEAEPTVFHYARVLATIFEETKEKELPHANLAKTLLKATEKIFLLLNDKNIATNLELLKRLYLPASDGRLYESSTLVLNNCNSRWESTGFGASFKFLLQIEGCSLFTDPYELEKLLQQFPEDIRPKMLSQITTESLHSMVECSLGDSCELKRQLQGLLSSSIFREGLASLLRSQNKGQISAEQATQECRAIFTKLEIICCEGLQTILLKGSETLTGTCLSKEVFIRKVNDGQCHVYLMHNEASDNRKTVKIMSSLAQEINEIMKNALNPVSTLILLQMLSCTCPQEINNVLKENNILTRKSASKATFSLPRPGQEIPGEWHDSLDMSIHNSFKVGDYVGYMEPSKEDVYLYAIILGQLESKISGETLVDMFRIDLGPDRIIDVSALELYQFKRHCASKNNCRELVMVENLDEQREKHDKWFEKSLADIKRQIDEQLNDIWKLSMDEQKRSIRRLYLLYHPDKNIGQEKLANQICKYLQQKIRELEEDANSGSQGCSKSQFKHSRGFSKFWRKWDGEASRHRKHREHFTGNFNRPYDFWGYQDWQKSKPKQEEARRWFRQAECDLRAAASDLDNSSSEWVLFKVHQGIEKCLIAAMYKKGDSISKDLPISSLAEKVSTFSVNLKEIREKVIALKSHGVDNKTTQYPDYHCMPDIPNDRCASDQEKVVIQLASDVLDKIKLYIQQ